LEKEAMARDKKKALTEGRTLVFVDESGLTQKPHRVRTWAPRGQTPVLQHHFNWDNLSAVAGITLLNFYFRVYDGAVKAEQVLDFLRHLMRQLPGKLLIVWDGLPAHRSRVVKSFVAEHAGKSGWSACRLMRLNSILWNISGATGRSTRCLTSVPRITSS
jgi:hypothetical protein